MLAAADGKVVSVREAAQLRFTQYKTVRQPAGYGSNGESCRAFLWANKLFCALNLSRKPQLPLVGRLAHYKSVCWTAGGSIRAV